MVQMPFSNSCRARRAESGSDQKYGVVGFLPTLLM